MGNLERIKVDTPGNYSWKKKSRKNPRTKMPKVRDTAGKKADLRKAT